jgi:glycosyltransferase involved in cell wall biosynthesis
VIIVNSKKIIPVTVVIPTYNEEEGIGPTVEEIGKFYDDARIIVIDGNSTDKTVEIARKMGVKILTQKGKGKGLAIAQVLKQINPEAEFLVLIDADFTYPAEHIPEMIEILKNEPDVGMVIGNRFHPKFVFKKVVNNILYFGNRTLAFTQYAINGVKLSDPLSGLRVLRWEAIKDWVPKSKGFDIEVEMNHFVHRQGYRTVEIPIRYRQRLGDKKLKIKDGLAIFKRILTESLAAKN